VVCTAQEDGGNALRRAADVGAAADLGSTASDAQSRLDALQRRMDERLTSMGALDAPPPPPAERGAFSMRSSDATRREADAMLLQMRRKKSGEAEAEHASAIQAARKMAQSWLAAGLPQRAEKELLSVAAFVSFKTEVGGEFHLQLADMIERCGRQSEARRMMGRVADETGSSSLRWRAEQQAGGTTWTPRGADSSSELGSLFGDQFGGGSWGR